VVLTTSDVISAGTPVSYTAAWPGGTAVSAVVPNTTVYIRTTASDPFGAADITAARLDWIRPDGTAALSGVSMGVVTSTAGTKTYEYAATIPPSGAGTWTARVTAVEGSEGIVTDVREATIVAGVPSINITKVAWTVSDPQNGSVNPKAIPGATVAYSLDVRNSGAGPADANSLALVDRVPTGTALRVADLGGPGSGPVLFSDGVVTSGLTLTFAGLGSLVDGVDFSNDGGVSFAYVPTPDADGRDPAVTHFRVRPQGSFRGSTGGGDPAFTVLVRLDVR
jgi:hypothetical protein